LINDTLGHYAGDRLLIRAANLLRETFGEHAVVARTGGDEFAVLTEYDEAAMQQVSEILRGLMEADSLASTELALNLSIGWAHHSGSALDEEALLALARLADDRMYRQKLSNSRSSQNKLVQGMLEMLKVRDYITEGHSQRMQQHVASLGRQADLDANQIADLCLLAQFHDIGKIGISDSILFKPSGLTPTERKEMERHSEIGCRIAQTIPELEPISDLILKHHEWWNGTGYPQRLKGEDIPVEDRILAIVDAYDAMTNDRPYRKAMTAAAAIEEIRALAGIQFDPVLAEQFIQLLMEENVKMTAP
jgi:diguanylate cyclase (GGDEF)-like protein